MGFSFTRGLMPPKSSEVVDAMQAQALTRKLVMCSFN